MKRYRVVHHCPPYGRFSAQRRYFWLFWGALYSGDTHGGEEMYNTHREALEAISDHRNGRLHRVVLWSKGHAP